MKKVLSVLLATLMLLTLLMPLSVFAKDGPYPVDWDNMTEEDWENLETISMISLMDYETYEIGYLYPEFMSAEMPVAKKGISYDVKTNTLTLNNYKSNEMLMMSAMGDDFKIKVSGYNEIGCIGSLDLGWGGSITVTGSGVLVVNNNKTYPAAVSMDVSGTGYGFFKTGKSVAVKLIGNIDTDLGEAEPTIYVSGSKEADSSKVIMLNGDVKASQANVKDSFSVNKYEQEELLWVDEYYGDYEFFERRMDDDYAGQLFIGEEVGEDEYGCATYNMSEVIYDETLNAYVVKVLENCQDIVPVEYDFWEITANSGIKLPEIVLEIPEETYPIDLCIGVNDEICGFIDYSDSSEPGTEVDVFEIIEHPVYGRMALVYKPQTTYKELKLIGEEIYYNHYNKSTTITTNTIVTKVPGKVTLKKAASAFGGVNVTWNAVSGADSYTIYRKAAGAKSWSTLGTSKTTSYLDKTAKTGTKYTYTVRAKNIIGLGSYDKTGVSTTYIAAPTVKIANASNGIKVSWSKVSGATGYTVYRSQYSGGKWSGWKNMGTAKADKSSWTDKSVKSGVQYRYTVRTVSGKSVSSFKATSGLVYLSTPTVKIANASTGVKVTWGKVAGAKNYIVYRSELSNGKWSGWKQISKVGAVTSTVDKTAKSGVYYKYTVKAVNGSSTGAYKASSQLLYLAQPTTKITNASNGIKVSWTKSTGSKGYTIYRSELKNGKWSSWKTMGTAAATKTSWVDKSAKAGVQYKYTVRAINGNVKSTYTATSGLIRLAQPAVKATLNENSIKVSWNKISGAKSYTVYRSELVDGKWTSWAIVSSQTALSFTDSAVTEGATYRYTVRAVNGKSLSSFVASANVIIPATQEDVAENVA